MQMLTIFKKVKDLIKRVEILESQVTYLQVSNTNIQKQLEQIEEDNKPPMTFGAK